MKQKGIGLLELMLSLAIIAILIVMVTRYYLTTRTSEQVNQAAEIVVALYSAGQSWLQSHNDFSTVSVKTFVDNNTVPEDFDSPNANPWGGGITATQGAAATSLSIELDKIPAGACQNLKARVTEKIINSKPDCTPPPPADPTKFTVDINMAQ